MANKHSVRDDGDPRKYYAAIPNIVFGIGLNPYELVLYVYLKKVAGEDGVCWKSTAAIAKDLGMGAATVSRTKSLLAKPRKEIGGKPLITITSEMQNGGFANHAITVTDIWPENMIELQRVRAEKVARSTREGAKPTTPSTQEGTPSTQEGTPSTQEGTPSTQEGTPSTGEHKNNPIRITQEEEPKKKVGAEAQPHPGVDLFRDVAGHYPRKELFGVVEAHLGNDPNELLARDCWREWLERGYNPQSLKWLTDWYANGGPTERKTSAVQSNGHGPKVELDPFGEPFISRPFTWEDAAFHCPEKNRDDIRLHFEGKLKWEDVRLV